MVFAQLTADVMGQKPMAEKDRDSVIGAIYVLNDILDALIAGTMVFNSYQKQYELGEFSQIGIVAVQKMCVSHLILGLSKLVEFRKHYNKIIPDDLRADLKSVVARLDNQDLRQFRNTVVAHIWDKELNRTRTQHETYDQLYRISGDSPKDFLKWLNDPDGNTYPKNLTSIVETLRDRLRKEHDVSPDEVFNR